MFPGCSEDGGASQNASASTHADEHGHEHGDGHSHDTPDAHEHPSEGPHHGHLVELGKEEFHAELVHDKSSVTIYLLDSTAKNAVAIDSTELIVNLKHDGKPEQFKLAAAAEPSDPAGKASKFVLQSEDFVKKLEHAESDARLNVTINGTPYSGSLTHNHDDHGHSH